MVQSGALSEPEGECCSSCSSYESLSSNSEIDDKIQEEAEEEIIEFNRRRASESCTVTTTTNTSTRTSYRSWYLRRRSSAGKIDSEAESKESLTVINEERKNWWYWIKLAVFMASPFIARQLGIIAGKRILSKAFKN